MRKILKTVNTVEEFNEKLYKELNIGVEIQDFTEPNLSKENKEEIICQYEEKLHNFEGVKSLHGPFLDLKPASPDLEIRKVSYKRYLDTLDLAADLNMDYIIFHSQINPYLNEPFLRDLNNKQAAEIWESLLSETKYEGIILIENIFEEEPLMLKEYMEILDNPRIKVNLDIGHAKLGKVGLDEWIEGLKEHLAYIHIHSNNGSYDQHKSPEEREIKELYKSLNKYKINPILSLEYKTENLKKEINKYI